MWGGTLALVIVVEIDPFEHWSWDDTQPKHQGPHARNPNPGSPAQTRIIIITVLIRYWSVTIHTPEYKGLLTSIQCYQPVQSANSRVH